MQRAEKGRIMTTRLIEIRAAEGGRDAKLLVEEQVAIYARMAQKECL